MPTPLKLLRMRHEDEWLDRVLAWRASGLSAKAYCADKSYLAGTLLTWSSRLGRDGKVERSVAGRKARPRTPASHGTMRFVRVVGSTRGTDASTSTTSTTTRDPSASMSSPHVMAIVIGSSRIEVRPGFDANLLRSVVSALGGDAR